MSTRKEHCSYRIMKNEEIDKSIFSYAKTILITIFTLTFIAQLALTSGSSMEPTLQNKNLLLVEKIHHTLNLDYDRFDIAIFKSDDKNKPYYIKRIIGLPGETIKIEDGSIYINDKLLPESYGKEFMEYAGIASETIKIDADSYFVLGDNRNNSRDSRFFGTVNKDKIIGKAIFDISKFCVL